MKKEAIVQFIKFGLVGVTNTLVSQIVYTVCIAFNMHYLIASVVAFIISVLNAYILQNLFVFKQDESLEKRSWWRVLLKTYTAYAFTGLLLNNLLLILWIDIIKIERFTVIFTELLARLGLQIENRKLAEIIAPLLNIVVNVPINFVINKFWAYRQKKKGDGGDSVVTSPADADDGKAADGGFGGATEKKADTSEQAEGGKQMADGVSDKNENEDEKS